MSFFENTRRPTGLGGKIMVGVMNLGHRALADWGMRFLDASADARVGLKMRFGRRRSPA